MGAVNFPQVQIPVRARGTRYLQIHRNVPGTLGRVVEVFSRRSLNIAAQYLQTDGEIGYVVIDADTPMDDGAAVLEELRALDGAVRAAALRTPVISPPPRQGGTRSPVRPVGGLSAGEVDRAAGDEPTAFR